jgi:hypothetical protein|tara:strand:+ start:963 stop:1250 length:288 start_codon:yes stop_codon:yes gene_type:complete
MKIFNWNDANILWNNNPYTWDEVQLIIEVAGDEDWDQWKKKKKQRLVKLILKIHGDTITESKRREIKQYKIKAKDIRIVVKEVLGTEMIAENVSI